MKRRSRRRRRRNPTSRVAATLLGVCGGLIGGGFINLLTKQPVGTGFVIYPLAGGTAGYLLSD